jgi:hypothetical protein
MSDHDTEDQLVEQPAIGLFAALGWRTVSALNESLGGADMVGRETKSEVALPGRPRDLELLQMIGSGNRSHYMAGAIFLAQAAPGRAVPLRQVRKGSPEWP